MFNFVELMKILVNTRLLLKDKLEGIGRFSYETLQRICKAHPEHEFIFAFDRNFSDEFIFSDNITPVIIDPQARHPILFYIWFEHAIPSLLKKLNVDLFLSPDGYLSLKTPVKSLAVIHDLNFEHYPNDLPFLVRKYYRYYFPKFAQKASRIATVSNYSKQDLIDTYQVEGEKIDVVYNGVNEIFQPINEIKKKEIKIKYTAGEDYFIFVGALHPRKNIGRLFQAFDAFKKADPSAMKLLIVGDKYYWPDTIKKIYSNLEYKEDVIFTGRLADDTLSDCIATSLAMVYVPYFEGFGIPILEAMQCETAVITSNVTAMPEVAGDAAILVNPFSIDSIKDGMLAIYKNSALRENYIEKGKARAKLFSWNKTAEALWQSIEKC